MISHNFDIVHVVEILSNKNLTTLVRRVASVYECIRVLRVHTCQLGSGEMAVYYNIAWLCRNVCDLRKLIQYQIFLLIRGQDVDCNKIIFILIATLATPSNYTGWSNKNGTAYFP